MQRIAITSYGFIDDTGLGGTRGYRDWSQLGADNITQLKWRAISDRPNDRFGRMDVLSKAAVAAAEMSGLTLDESDCCDDFAVVLGTKHACMDVDAAFLRTTNRSVPPSPMLFASGLPSIAAAEVAIRFHLRGEHICVLAGDASGGSAFWEAVSLLDTNEVPRCLCIVADAITADTTDALCAIAGEPAKPICHAYAFVFEAINPPADSCTASALAICHFSMHGDQERCASVDASSHFEAKLCAFLRGDSRDRRDMMVAPPASISSERSICIEKPGRGRD